MTPLLPCHGPFFIAAAATWIILRRTHQSVEHRASNTRSTGRNTHLVVQAASPVTDASTLVPSIYLPLLYVKSQLAAEREQSRAWIVSSTMLFAFVFAFRIQFAAATAAFVYWLWPVACARYAESVRKSLSQCPPRQRAASAATLAYITCEGGTHPVVTEFRLSSSAVGRQNTAPAFVTPLQLPWMPKFFTDVLPEDACALVIWLRSCGHM